IVDGANALDALADVLRAAGGARHLLEQTWREEMAEGVDVAHGSSTPVNYPLIPAPAFAGTSGIETVDHRRRTHLGDYTLVIAELGQDGIGVLAEHRRGQGARVAGAVDEHRAMNGGDLAFSRMPLPVERAQMAHLRIVEHVRDAVDRRERHVVFFEHIHPM